MLLPCYRFAKSSVFNALVHYSPILLYKLLKFEKSQTLRSYYRQIVNDTLFLMYAFEPKDSMAIVALKSRQSFFNDLTRSFNAFTISRCNVTTSVTLFKLV